MVGIPHSGAYLDYVLEAVKIVPPKLLCESQLDASGCLGLSDWQES